MPRPQVSQDNLFSKFYNTQLLEGASHTLDATYVYTINLFAATIAQTLIIPADFSQASWPVGAAAYLVPIGTGGVSIDPAANVLLNGGTANVDLGTTAYGGNFVLLRSGVNDWLLLAGIASAGGLAATSLSGYIDGFTMSFVDIDSVSISSGNAFIPSSETILSSEFAIVLDGQPAAGANHFYLFDDGGVANIERSTTAPVLYSGTAYTKTGDNTRRYLGSLIGAGGDYLNFNHINNWVYFATNQVALTNGQAAFIPTAIDLSALAPITTILVAIAARNTDGAQSVGVNRDSTNQHLFLLPGDYAATVMPVVAGPAISYFYSLAPTTGLDVTMSGFYFGR